MNKLFENKNIIMFIKFGCVGVLNTLIDSAVFFLMCDIAGINEIISNVAAYTVAATNSYFLNSRFVYHDAELSLKKYTAFLTANVSVLIISTIFILILTSYVPYKTVAKLISVPITVLINFVLQRFVVFKKSADKYINESEEKKDAEMDS